MPKRKQQEEKQETTWKFANINFDEATKGVFGAYCDEVTFDDAFTILIDILVEHRVSLSYNSENDHYVCAITGTNGSINAGITCSSFARDVEKAIQVAVFKHSELAKGDYRPFTQRNRQTEDFG